VTDTRRVEAFSDGVFAIAITLLVLDLRVPEFESGRLFHDLVHLWGAYIAYISSFLYIGVIWLNHHAAFTRIDRIDRGLQWANLALLFTTALLPFPTAVLSSALQSGGTSDRRTAVVLYALIAGAMAAAWLGLFHRLSNHPELTGGDDDAAFFRRERGRAWLGIGSYGVAACAGLIYPVAALPFFLVLPIFYALTSEGKR
jgi:TMEM175 potassium channel family protein